MRNAKAQAGVVALLALLGCGVAGCPDETEHPKEALVAEEVFGRMGEPVAYATPEQLASFERGVAVSQRRFTTDDGLGPGFNVSFCGSCHEQPTFGGSAPRYRDFLIHADVLSDGTLVMLGNDGVLPHFQTSPPYRTPTPPSAELFVRRNAIPFFGVGALAEIPSAAIEANADPTDEDGDGISGRPNIVEGFVGRFGVKSQTASIEGFIRGPLFNHMGVTSNPLSQAMKAALPVPSDNSGGDPMALRQARFLGGFPCLNCQAAAPDEPIVDGDGVPDPELSEQELFDLVSASMLLAAPQPDPPTEATERGRVRFQEVGCASCHVPGLEGPRGLVMAYTDLLLHDMGEELADGLEQSLATGSEFRTAPLWGVAATGPYLHDGRADTLDQAIRLHGGEGQGAKQAYEALSPAERDDLVTFLRSLGGADVASEGLLPPDAPVPGVGEFGGPERALTADEAALFERGRAVFDQDFDTGTGLGERFNGDSCRACHFEPVIGGAGPVGLNVTRQGVIDEATGEFFMPEGATGTMLHRHQIPIGRPEGDPHANVFELRQTPPTFGLGLIDRIPEATILAAEDPDDVDGDGISGRAPRMEDGRIGRFGWKSILPTLEDFVRDALSNEVGLTLAEDPEMLAGAVDDAPEFAGADYEALVFYAATLGPPPRTAEPHTVRGGEAVFAEVGCADCHTPQMTTADGVAVPLYSDLLLHDVMADGAAGIADGGATMGEFRTPPLWGMAVTGPYMHDGLAPTPDAAIRRHEGEARASREAYEALSEAEREALLEFLESL